MLKKLILLAVAASLSFAVTVPRPCGKVPFTVPGKGPMNLADFYGKVIIVSVFKTTCPECRHTARLLTKIQNDLKPQGLQVVELAFDDVDNEAVIKKFVREFNPSYPVGIIDAEKLAEWGQLTAEMHPTVPMLFFINRNGFIEGQYMGAEPFMMESLQDANIRAKLKRMLEQPVPKGAQPKNAAAKPAAPSKK